MGVWVCLPLLCAGLFAVSAPSLSRQLPPAAATWLLSIGSLLAAVGSTVSLALVGFTFVAQNRKLAQSGHWSGQTLRHDGTIWTPVAVLAVVAVIVLAARTALVGWRRVTALRQAYQLAAALPAPGGELVVLDLPDRQALALPGRPGQRPARPEMLSLPAERSWLPPTPKWPRESVRYGGHRHPCRPGIWRSCSACWPPPPWPPSQQPTTPNIFSNSPNPPTSTDPADSRVMDVRVRNMSGSTTPQRRAPSQPSSRK